MPSKVDKNESFLSPSLLQCYFGFNTLNLCLQDYIISWGIEQHAHKILHGKKKKKKRSHVYILFFIIWAENHTQIKCQYILPMVYHLAPWGYPQPSVTWCETTQSLLTKTHTWEEEKQVGWWQFVFQPVNLLNTVLFLLLQARGFSQPEVKLLRLCLKSSWPIWRFI